MRRFIDHLVLPCRDLAAAAADCAELGFTVGRRNRHPWGTENHVIQFDGVFLELIAFAPDAPPPSPDDDAYPFAGFLAGLISGTEPSGMIVLRSADAVADAQAFQRDGIGEGRMLHFARSAAAPDGGSRTVSFSLAFAKAASLPAIGFFTCQQHAPENFWNPALQQHANGVTGLAAVTLLADEPDLHTDVLTKLTGRPAIRRGSGMTFDCGNGRIDVLEAGAMGATRLGAIYLATSTPREGQVVATVGGHHVVIGYSAAAQSISAG